MYARLLNELQIVNMNLVESSCIRYRIIEGREGNTYMTNMPCLQSDLGEEWFDVGLGRRTRRGAKDFGKSEAVIRIE